MVSSADILNASILIVDDQEAKVQLLEQMLSNAGYLRITSTRDPRVIKALSQPYVVEGTTISITTSAGVSLYPEHGGDAETLMKSADLALYEAKRARKNVFRISECTDRSRDCAPQHKPPASGTPWPDAAAKTKDGQ